MNVFVIVKQKLIEAISEIYDTNISDKVSLAMVVEVPKQNQGDLSSNVALLLSKFVKDNPIAIAEKITSKIIGSVLFDSVTVAKPGFINMMLSNETLFEIMSCVVLDPVAYSFTDIGKGKKVNIEYVSVNPTGPLHIGHARCAIYGDVLANLMMKVGYQVVKEYYINDAGNQIDILANSLYLRYLEILGQEVTIAENLYPGEYLITVAEQLYEKYKEQLRLYEPKQRSVILKDFAVSAIMLMIKNSLNNIGINHDVFTSELQIQQDGFIEEAISKLSDRDYITTGFLVKPKGKSSDDWQQRAQKLFSATKFGDSEDRALTKIDGSYTYFSGDLGYILHKMQRGFSELVYILGADHIGYKIRLEAAISALSDGKIASNIQYCKLVNVVNDGKIVRMSKRAGNFITMDEVYDIVGKDVLRFMMISKTNDTILDFDIEKVQQQSNDNPVFYVQYAHARCSSVLNNIKTGNQQVYELFNKSLDKKELIKLFSYLSNKQELAVIRTVMLWPNVIIGAVSARQPHRIIFYLESLAKEFHKLWHMGKENDKLRFNHPNLNIAAARYGMVLSVKSIIALALDICGIYAVNEM